MLAGTTPVEGCVVVHTVHDGPVQPLPGHRTSTRFSKDKRRKGGNPYSNARGKKA
jgi:hypothetical protein